MLRINRLRNSQIRDSRLRDYWYIAACVCLLIVAAGLRFYNLSDGALWSDEAVAATNSWGALSDVLHNTRHNNSSPILYPLALYAVQKVEISPLSIRLLPAVSSVLSIAAILFLLPRAGVRREIAFLAALLAALSIAAISNAQDAREYSIDALLAVLMTAGLLWYLRDSKKTLLCASLFLAPLLQYGLVLFGAAILTAAAISATPSIRAENRLPDSTRLWDRLKLRLPLLLWPGAFFLAGCAITYALTLRYQGGAGWAVTGYLREYYYQGEYNAIQVLDFTISRTWGLLSYHLHEVIAALVLAAIAFLLLSVGAKRLNTRLHKNTRPRRNRRNTRPRRNNKDGGNGGSDYNTGNESEFPFNAIMFLLLIAFAIAAIAALAGWYPFGGTKQTAYLSPIIFLAAGFAIYSAANKLARITRRAWLAPGLTAAAVGAIALTTAVAIGPDAPYRSKANHNAIRSIIQERQQAGDIVYVDRNIVPHTAFYHAENPANYYYGERNCSQFTDGCIHDIVNAALSHTDGGATGIWLIYPDGNLVSEMEKREKQIIVEGVITYGNPHLYLIANTGEALANLQDTWLRDYQSIISGEPAARSVFDLYLVENKLHYVKEPCSPDDTKARFLLHLEPYETDDLPANRQQHGFDNLDFNFNQRGIMHNGKCLATIPLPNYPITNIGTGQFISGKGTLWATGFPPPSQ